MYPLRDLSSYCPLNFSIILQLFIKAKSDSLCESAELIDASALRGEYKSAPITQASNNVLRIDPAVKTASKEKRFHSKVYVGTVHASLKCLPNRNWYPGEYGAFCCQCLHVSLHALPYTAVTRRTSR